MGSSIVERFELGDTGVSKIILLVNWPGGG